MEGGPNIQEVEGGSNSLESTEENENTWIYSCCHPRGKMHRFVALLFMCFLGFGKCFVVDYIFFRGYVVTFDKKKIFMFYLINKQK